MNKDIPLPSIDQESNFPLSLSPALAPEFSSPTDVNEDALVSANPPTTLNDSFELEEGDECGNPSELDLSVTIDFVHQEIEESEEPILQSQCEETLELTRLEFSDDILSVEYESSSYAFGCGFVC